MTRMPRSMLLLAGSMMLAETTVHADSGAGDPSGEVTGIVITATRQQQSLLDLVGNASLIDRAHITATMPQRPSELLNQLPGVAVEQGSGEEEIAAIRSPALNGGAGQGSVLLLEDGVPLRAAGFGNVNGLYEANAEQAGSIELVRGPGSALYGSNAVHGLINFIPRNPSATAEASLDLTGGSYGYGEALASVSDSFGDRGARLSAEVHHESGWRRDTRLDEQKFVARGLWQAGADQVTVTLSGQDLDQQTGAYIMGKDAYLNRAIDKTNPIPTAFRKADLIRFMARWQDTLSESLQLSVTPYARYSAMNFSMFYLPTDATQSNTHYSAGMQNALYKRLAGGHLVILGLDAEYTDGWYSEFQTKPTFRQGNNLYPYGLHYDLAVAAEVVAPYLHSEWQVLEHTRISAGIRLEETVYDYTDRTANGIFGLYQRPPSRKDEFTTVMPKLGLVQQWRPGLASYINLTRGARAPQVTDLYELQNKQKVGQVKAESINSGEIGSRGDWRGISFDATAYWMDKSHYFYRAADGTNVPDGRTEHRGLELEVTAPLGHTIDISAGGTEALHTYSFSYHDSTLINTVTKGTSIPNAPHSLANVRLGYRFMDSTRAELELVHMGSYFTDNANIHAYGGHNLVNLRLTAKLTDNFNLHAKVMNLTDRAYADRAAVTTTGIDQYFPGAPRTILVGVGADF